MSTIKLKKGFDLKLKGGITSPDKLGGKIVGKICTIVPDDFHGITPRLDKKEGEHVAAGEAIYHDKVYEAVKITSPISGVVKEVRRGARRKIEAIIIESDGQDDVVNHDLSAPSLEVLLASGLWPMLRQRPYDVVPNPDERPRDIFVTAFDSAPLAPSLLKSAQMQYAAKGVEILSKLTDGGVHIGFAKGETQEISGAKVYEFDGPHPAGNVGVQIANISPVNKGEIVWTLDIVTLCRIGELFTTGKVNFTTLVAITGEQITEPCYVETVMGCPIKDILNGKLVNNEYENRIISGNVLTGIKVTEEEWLRAPYRHITVIPEVKNRDEFMGWLSVNPKRFSIYRMFTSWLTGLNKEVSMDARMKGGERAIVRLGEYDRMLPMDIYAEFLIKAVIAFDIDKMEQLGIYEVAPEDFALAEYADTSKIELQRIIREGLDRMRAEMA